MKVPRVLIVDDDATVLDSLRIAFEGKPWRVDAVTLAAEALGRHREEAYDLLIVDKNLPGMDGIELIRELRSKRDPVGIIMLTGYGSVESAQETLNLGIDAYLLKPFSPLDVTSTAEELLTRVMMTSRLARISSGAASPPDDDVPTNELKRPPPAKPKSFLILVAGPESKGRARLAAHLEAKPDELRYAGDMTDLMSIVATERPDLVILQGVLDAPEVVAKVRERSPDTACVVVAENPGLAAVTRLIDLQITALLGDAADSDALKKRLNQIVNRLRTHKERVSAMGEVQG